MIAYSSMLPDIGLNGINKDIANSVSMRYVGVASFTVLVWDHVITFSDEVEYIWKGRKGLAVYLFFVNRYLIPLSFGQHPGIFHQSLGKTRECGHFVRYGGAMTMIGISIVFLMMFLRIRALYERFLSVQAFVLTILLAFIGVNSYVLSRDTPVQHPAQFPVESCTMIVEQKVGRTLTSSTAWIPLLYGTVVISLTLYRTMGFLYAKSASTVCRILFREGLLYYSVICTITLVLTIMVDSTLQSIRDVASQLHLCLTVAMMSRITLHPKRFANSPNRIIYLDGAPQPRPHPQYFPTISQPMTSASPPALSSTRTAQQQVRSLLPSSSPCDHARASASSLSSSENVSYLEMETLARTSHT